MRCQHEVAACSYHGIATLDFGEVELDSRRIALLRAAGPGMNGATFGEFEPGERICSDCSAHEVTCDLCGRVLDEGEYSRANDNKAFVCSVFVSRLDDQLEATRDR